jgi:ABC-type spermidine/putrescine transport system permease subunit I
MLTCRPPTERRRIVAESTLGSPAVDRAARSRNRAILDRQRRMIQWRYVALVVPMILYLIVFYAYPVAAMLFRSIHEPTWSITNYTRMIQTNVYARVLWNTTRVALVVTVATLLLSYPLAYLLATIRNARANLLIILVLVPFWTSILVRSYAWMVLLGRQGIINELLSSLGLIDQPLRLLNTTFAVYIAMVHILLPFMVLPLYSVMRGIDKNLMLAAEGLGAPPTQVFRRVFFPLSLPGIAAGCLLVFILALGFYITPALVGGPKDLMIAVLIAQQIDLFNWPFAAALAAVLLAGALAIFVVFNRILGVERIFGGART